VFSFLKKEKGSFTCPFPQQSLAQPSSLPCKLASVNQTFPSIPIHVFASSFFPDLKSAMHFGQSLFPRKMLISFRKKTLWQLSQRKQFRISLRLAEFLQLPDIAAQPATLQPARLLMLR
jgi:hypothetical protein